MKLRLFLIFSILSTLIFCQEPDPFTKMIACSRILKAGDIDHAISVGKVNKLFLKCSPVGSGSKNEVGSGRKRDKHFFEKEHNTVWIKFKIPKRGKMEFSIKPRIIDNDYDFLLYKIENETSINDIKSKRKKPIRSNLSRNNKDLKGITGLKISATETHVTSGINEAFSSSIDVKKNEVYYLVIDNVYDDGEGAIVEFNYYETKKISGYVTNETKDKNIAADVSWDDAETGKTLQTTKADPKTGYFEMNVPFVINDPKKLYILAIDAEEYFFDEKMLSVEELQDLNPKPIRIALPHLKKGKKLKISNIHFEGGKPTFITSSLPSLKRLKKLMKKNKTLKILIEGHTNGCPKGAIDSQVLSERRALRVKKYLFENGIEETRVNTIGHGCSKLLYPITGTAEQQQLNRRVEILVLEY